MFFYSGNEDMTEKTMEELEKQIQALESKLKHANNKIAKLESQNKEFKLTIKDMDRRIMRGLKD
jgi:septal ring factor EnvC (AmiA/AmiB activator)